MATSAAGPRVREAVALSRQSRRAVIEGFFSRYPPGGGSQLGCGRAVADFLQWESDSGRVVDEGGSPWWKAMNGMIVLDLLESYRAFRGDAQPLREPSAAWLAFATDAETSGRQERFWEAHGQSVHLAAEACSSLMATEAKPEREFIALAMHAVDQAAALLVPSDTPDLGATARRLYPLTYPATEDALARLRRGLGLCS